MLTLGYSPLSIQVNVLDEFLQNFFLYDYKLKLAATFEKF